VIDEHALETWNDEFEELFVPTGHRSRRVEPGGTLLPGGG
jgi:hypothetical protein